MKIIITFITLLLLQAPCIAQQNHVPNGSFEQYNLCPDGISKIHYSTGWRSFNTGTPDYFHPCGVSYVGTPANYFGYQHPASGQAYAGLYTNVGTNDTKEYLATEIHALTPGTEYMVSMSVCLIEKARVGTNDLGVFFYRTGPNSYPNTTTLAVTPQVSFSSYGAITDTVNWVRLTKNFIADSAYSNIVIGGFLKPQDQIKDTINAAGTNNGYYYIDSVVIMLPPVFRFICSDSMFCVGDTFSIPYIAQGNYSFNNTFTIQLSDPLGDFTNATNIGSLQYYQSGTIKCTIPKNAMPGKGYKLRLLASDVNDTTDNYSPTIAIGGNFGMKASSNAPVCKNDTLQLTATTTTPGLTYQWSGPGGFTSTLKNPIVHNPSQAYAGNYIVAAQLYGCIEIDTIGVVFKDGYHPKNLSTGSNTPLCQSDTMQLSANADGAVFNYAWTGPLGFTANQPSVAFRATDIAMSGSYIVTISNGACSATDTIDVEVYAGPDSPIIVSNSPLTIGGSLLLELTNPKNGASFSWTGPDGFKSNLHKPYIATTTITNAGKYTLTTTLGECTKTAEIDVVILGLEEGTFVLYPNPNNGTFKIEGPVNNNNTIPVGIYSIMGQLIHKQDIIPANKMVSENITLEGKLASGVYFVKLVVNGEARVIPMTVSR